MATARYEVQRTVGPDPIHERTERCNPRPAFESEFSQRKGDVIQQKFLTGFDQSWGSLRRYRS